MGYLRYRLFVVTANLSLLAHLEPGLRERQAPGPGGGEQQPGHEGLPFHGAADSELRSSDWPSDILAATRPTRQLIQLKSRTSTDSYAAEWDPVEAKTGKAATTGYAAASKQSHAVLTPEAAPAVRKEPAPRRRRSARGEALPAASAEVREEKPTLPPHTEKLSSRPSSQHHSGMQDAAALAYAPRVPQQRPQQQQQQFFQLLERMADLARAKGQMWQHGRETDSHGAAMRGIVTVVVIVGVMVSAVIASVYWIRHGALRDSRPPERRPWHPSPSPHRPRGPWSPPSPGDPHLPLLASRDPAAVRAGTASPHSTAGSMSLQALSRNISTTLSRNISAALSRNTSAALAMPQTPGDPWQGGELVVPAGKECCLFLPPIPTRTVLEGGQLSLDDVNGTPVFDVTFFPCGEAAGKCFVLKSAVDDFAFGYCQEAEDGAPADSLALCHHTGTPFGILRPDQGGGFTLRAINGWTVSIQDDGQNRAWAIEVSSGRLLAVTEVGLSGTVQRIMRIGPAVDAGLMGLMMLGTDILLYRLHNLERAARSASREGQYK